jgi:ribosomal protein S13
MRPHIRPLTEAEIESLEQALGKPVARKDLVYWVSKSIEDMVRLASKPTPRRLRDSLLQFEREGREWLTDIAESESASFLAARANLPEFTAAASAFCDQVASLAREVHCLVRPGRSCTPAALEAFVDRMLGIAKRAHVLPSTPSRAENRQRVYPPAFFGFVTTALRVARQVIKRSPLPEEQKAAALSQTQIRSREALIKLVVKVRGRIGGYRETPYGLVEWKSD